VADVVSKTEQFALFIRRISGGSRPAETGELPARARSVQPLARWLSVPVAATLLLTLCSCGSVEAAFRGLAQRIEDLGKSNKTEETAQAPQAAALPKPAVHGKKTESKAEAKPELSQQDLFEYIRGKLLSLSPNDGINDNLEVTYDAPSSTLSIVQPDGRCDIFLNAIDTNNMIWEVRDPSDAYHTSGDILRLTLTASSGKPARVCYDDKNQIDKSIASNRARLLFAQNKANAVPGFTDNMTKAIKKLVVQSGGVAEKKIF
jgi:hypothetical protein